MLMLWCMLTTVPRSKKTSPPPSPSEPTQINLKLSAELLGAVDALVEEVNQRRPWPKMTRSDLIRELLSKAVEERPGWLLGQSDAE